MGMSLGVGPVTAGGSGSTITLTLPGTTAGRQLIVGVTWRNNAASISSISCSGESNLTVHGSVSNNTLQTFSCQLASLANITTGGTKTITVTMSSALGSAASAFVVEIADGATTGFFNAVANANSDGSTNPTVNVAAANAKSLVVAIVNMSQTPTAGAGFTLVSMTGSGVMARWEYMLDAGAAGTKTANMTAASGGWVMAAATFNAGPPPPFLGSWTMPMFTADSGAFGDNGNHAYTAANTLPSLTMSGGFSRAGMWIGDMALPMFGLDAALVAAPREWTGNFTLPLFTLDSGIAEAPYQTGDFTLPLFEVSGDYVVGHTYIGNFRMPLFGFEGELQVGHTYTGEWTLPLFQMQGGAFNDPVYVARWTLPLFSMHGRIEGPIAPVFNTWPVNLKNAALTQYDNFAFNSLARYNGEYLGAGAAGVFALAGPDDDGAAIVARVRLALTNFGMEQLKRAEEVFVSYRSDGVLTLRVVVEGGQSYDYQLPPTGAKGMQTNRAPVGKGLKLTYWCFEVENFEGAPFDLDAIRLKPVVLSRVIGAT